MEDLKRIFDEIGGEATFNAIAELGDYQRDSGLPFSYRTGEELKEMLEVFVADETEEGRYPSLEILKLKIKENE